MTNENREGNKKTELGWIPEDWNAESISQGYHINKYSLKNTTEPEYKLKYIDIESVTEGKIAGYKEYKFKDSPSRARRIVSKGDILLSTVRPYLKAFAQVKCNDENLICSTGFAVLNSKDDSKRINRYLYHFSFSDIFMKQIQNKMVGSNYPAINSEDLKNTLITLPKLNEQIKISDILDSIDININQIDNHIQDLTQLKKALAKKLLTEGIGHSSFKDSEVGRIPVEWEVKNLSDIAHLVMGQSPKSSSCNEDGVGIPFYQGKTEFGYMYPEVKKWCSSPIKIVQPLDVLISVRAPVGTLNICKETSCIGRGLGAVRETDKSYYQFLYYLLDNSHSKLNEVGQGSTFTAINSNDLACLRVAVPDIKEQQKIAKILFALDNQITQYQAQKSDYTQLKQGLMQQLLTGKVRVKV